MFRWIRRIAAAPTRPADAAFAYPGIDRKSIVYAIGDIHGRSDLLEIVFDAIDRDKALEPSKRTLEVYLGDYVDRGPDSAGVIARLRRRAVGRPVRMLLGNHEAVLLEFLDGDVAGHAWLDFGGAATARSYGVDPRRTGDLVDAMKAAVPLGHVAFLRALHPFFSYGPYAFVHAGLRPNIPLEDQSVGDLIWIREEFLNFAGSFGQVVIHGHTPRAEPEFRSNRIDIDTGAFATNRLTCLRIDSSGVRLLET